MSMTQAQHEQVYTREGCEALFARCLSWKLSAIIFLAGDIFWFGAWVFAVGHWGTK